VIARHFPHPRGMLYFDLFWHRREPEQGIHLITGEISGEGPWKIGEFVINVLGCHGTDAELAMEFDNWRNYLLHAADDYPPEDEIVAIAARHGARPA
jgi:hypothetical protein